MRSIGAIVVCSIILFSGIHNRAAANASAQSLLSAVVKIRATIPKEADSASSLGTEREGSGVVIDSAGTILTVGYLVREAEKIEVSVLEGKPVGAVVVGYDYETGFGLLRTDKPLGVAPIALGKSQAVKVGNMMLVAGYGGEESAQAVRVISRNEFAGYWEYLLEEAIYTFPAYTNFGGAALIDSEGKLVGIGSLFSQLTISGVGLLPCNVFIPIDLLNPIFSDLKKTGKSGKAQRPWLGINAEEAHGRVFITRVTAGGPAEKAGLNPGDMMLMVDGKEVTGLADFYRKLWAVGNAGVQVRLSILQGTKVRDAIVRSTDRDRRPKPEPRKSEQGTYISL